MADLPGWTKPYRPQMTQERAKEIWSRAVSLYPEWSEGVGKVMTPEEYEDIKAYWKTLPGSSCFMDAFFRVLNDHVGVP